MRYAVQHGTERFNISVTQVVAEHHDEIRLTVRRDWIDGCCPTEPSGSQRRVLELGSYNNSSFATVLWRPQSFHGRPAPNAT